MAPLVPELVVVDVPVVGMVEVVVVVVVVLLWEVLSNRGVVSSDIVPVDCRGG
jgi:hypothetical protein